MAKMCTCRWRCWIVFLLILFAGGHVSTAQTNADPYRGLVGVWAGTILVDHEHLPKDVSLTISELASGKGMLWDYTFGRPGQKGFDRASKVVTLSPAKSTMRTHWWGYRELTFETTGLVEFASKGIGTFSACAPLGERNFWGRKTDAASCVTFTVEACKFAYVWRTTRNGITSVWSQFEFNRTPQRGATLRPVFNRKSEVTRGVQDGSRTGSTAGADAAAGCGACGGDWVG